MKATSSQLKSFLRVYKNAYVTIDLGNGPMMVKVIKSALSDSISRPEYADSMWHYEFMQTETGVDLRLLGEAEEENTSVEEVEDNEEFDSETMSYAEQYEEGMLHE